MTIKNYTLKNSESLIINGSICTDWDEKFREYICSNNTVSFDEIYDSSVWLVEIEEIEIPRRIKEFFRFFKRVIKTMETEKPKYIVCPQGTLDFVLESAYEMNEMLEEDIYELLEFVENVVVYRVDYKGELK